MQKKDRNKKTYGIEKEGKEGRSRYINCCTFLIITTCIISVERSSKPSGVLRWATEQQEIPHWLPTHEQSQSVSLEKTELMTDHLIFCTNALSLHLLSLFKVQLEWIKTCNCLILTPSKMLAVFTCSPNVLIIIGLKAQTEIRIYWLKLNSFIEEFTTYQNNYKQIIFQLRSFCIPPSWR